MRQFIVLGFKTTDTSEQGEQVHLGGDRAESIAVTNAADDRFVRKQLYELAVPHLSRHFAREKAPASTAGAVTDAPAKGPTLTKGAQELVDEYQLTAADLAEIEPSGASGNIVKEDVQAWLAS